MSDLQHLRRLTDAIRDVNYEEMTDAADRLADSIEGSGDSSILGLMDADDLILILRGMAALANPAGL